ncbi:MULTISPECIES: AbrB/MazE/SpoVT family DNA-binding domain-containing protein [Metallosphaera]|uniref:Transcriptional regulator, AbrB family n=4 Tax=Metallosphaera TaxID=41980 RepID=A4YGS3_METS5|nr:MULTISPECIES: AbrB/MazE/SpoVT family DNA-binding domain-containing protein [Metallosphaera]BCS93954.1 MAG: AbrB family transcriptional regulator [Metallosphaera javensis (ex Sakai et al. 2022)]ABP95625.1 transcriptional regulator, AbrB family [Metallosphaera sedula DSM 5348]AIM27609.1 transcriptional regulator, AbrB family [Metallosphaera sedula]AKV74467.1 AbrB family transcriptional regulator [Metallosphaera sedula]AKV76706.1 AbrB family transcriptional regulator [Metallosphaera sedula]
MAVEDIVKVSRNYQVTIPARIRQKFQIKEGDLVRVVFDENENSVKILPMKQ